MNSPNKWEEYLHLVEFTYNNAYQKYLGMAPFEALYGRKCRTPISWDNLGDKVSIEPNLLH